jgi:hypothetical protein
MRNESWFILKMSQNLEVRDCGSMPWECGFQTYQLCVCRDGCCNTQFRMKPQCSTEMAEGLPMIFWNLPEEAFLESARRDAYIVL